MTDPDLLPAKAGDFARSHPEVWQAYAALGSACAAAGPLDACTQRLLKLALALAVESEGAVHSHVRRAREAGISTAELTHVAVLAIPTVGFPRAMRLLSWIEDITEG